LTPARRRGAARSSVRGAAVGFVCGAAIAVIAVAAPNARAAGASAVETVVAPRIEVRSADLLLVGLVQGDRMSLHLSRNVDNAPVRDATVAAILRGATHAAVAETDGGYAFETPDLLLPGAATVEFRITQGGRSESLRGTLQGAAAQRDEDKNGIRQYLWWVLNFGVCIGFLMLYARRRKAAEEAEEAGDA
jgi:hypothetical protein